MSAEPGAFDRGDWAAVIAAHDPSTTDPSRWLELAVARLRSKGAEEVEWEHLEEAARAFAAAAAQGAPSAAVKEAQQHCLLALQGDLMRAAERIPEAEDLQQRAADALARARHRLRQRRQHLEHGGKPLIRTIHHLACTGGTVISKCMAAMPHVALISEVNPFNRFGSTFEPTNPLLLLEQSYRKLSAEEIEENFRLEIRQVVKICEKDGMDLVIRDHSHTDFCMGEKPSEVTPILDFLGSDYSLLSAATIRHPLDSYLGLLHEGWHEQFQPSTLEEYCLRYLCFLDRYKDLPLLRYEDFCQEPDSFLESLCSLLQIQFSPSYVHKFGSVTLSGDSGRRSGETIGPRPRREVSPEVNAEISESPSYRALLTRLVYPA